MTLIFEQCQQQESAGIIVPPTIFDDIAAVRIGYARNGAPHDGRMLHDDTLDHGPMR